VRLEAELRERNPAAALLWAPMTRTAWPRLVLEVYCVNGGRRSLLPNPCTGGGLGGLPGRVAGASDVFFFLRRDFLQQPTASSKKADEVPGGTLAA